MKKRILAGFMSLLLVGNMLTSNVMTYAAESERVQEVATDEMDVTEPMEEVRVVTPSDAEKTGNSITDESTVKIPGDHGDIMTPEQFQKASQSILDMKLLQAETALQNEKGEFPVKNVKLYRQKGGNWVELEEDETISLDDKFRVVYVFNEGETNPIVVNWPEDATDTPEGICIKKDEVYTLPGLQNVINTIKLTGNHEIKVIATDEDHNPHELGTVTVKEDGTVEFSVTYEEKGMEFYDVTVAIGFTLDKKELEKEDKLVFEIPFGEKRYDLPIQENKPTTTVKKTASDAISADNEIEWTITVENLGVSENGFSLTDYIHDNHKYVDDSIQYVMSPSNADCTWTMTASDANKKLEFSIDNKTPGTTLKFTYKTIVDVFGAVKDWTKGDQIKKIPANNTAVLVDKDTDQEVGRATAGKEIQKEMKSWITKNGGVIGENGVIDWTITVNNNGYDIQDVIVYDDFDYNIMDVIQSSIKIDGDPADRTKFTESPDHKDGYCWKYELGDMSGNQSYKITYQTQIKNFEDWKKQNYNAVTNKAWISYKYNNPYDGDGQPTDKIGPTVEKNAQIQQKAAISKRAVGYSAATQIVEWEVTVNKYKADMTGVVVRDHIKEGQVFYKIGKATLTASASNAQSEELDLSDKITITSDPNKKKNDGREIVEIKFGDLLKGKSATFKIYTKFNDPKRANEWAGNNSRWIWNNVYLEHDGSSKEIPADASLFYTSTVVKKEVEKAYDYKTHYIGYKITFNQNKMEMEDIRLEDDMAGGHLELVENDNTHHPITLESLTRQADEPITLTNDPRQPNYYEYDKKSGKLVIHTSDIKATASDAAKTKVVRYTAKVANGDAYKENNGTSTITNRTKLITAANPNGTETSCSTTFTNNIIAKTHGQTDDETGNVTYTVAFNAAEQPLAEKLQVVDLLGSGLLFVDDSIEMYKGIVQADGTVLKDGSQLYKDYSYEITAEGGKSKLTVTLPHGGNAAYVLEYKVQIYDTKGELTNSASLKGYSEGNSFGADSSLTIEDATTGYVRKSVFVKVYKEDADDQTPLAGAKFAIYDSEGNEVVITSNARGIAMSSGKLVPNTEYTLEEIEAPTGYKRDTTKYKFTAEEGLTKAFTKTIPNEKIKKGAIIIKKVLNGIEFDKVKDKLAFVVKKADGTTVRTIGLSEFSASDADHKYTADQFESSKEDNTYVYEITEIPDTYYVEETGTDQLDGYDETKVKHAVKATDANGTRVIDEEPHEGAATETFELKENGTAEAAFENTYEKLGKLIITKTISGDVTSEEAAKTIKFKVTDNADGESKEYSLDRDFTYNKTTDRYELELVKTAGGYTVEETAYALNGCRAAVTYTVDGKTETGTKTTIDVPSGASREVDFEDNYTAFGDLLITKTIKGDVAEEELNTVLKFRVTDNTTKESQDYTLKDFTFNKVNKRYELLLKDKKTGSYTVEETAYDIDGNTVTVTYSVNSARMTEGFKTEADVTRGEATAVNFEDAYEKFGSLVITKRVNGSVTKEEAESVIVFTVKDDQTGETTDYKLSDFTYDADEKIWIKELPLVKGGYTVTETVTDISGYRLASVTYRIDDHKAEEGTESKLTVEAGKTTTVAYEDDYRKKSSGGNGGGGNGGGSTTPTKPDETTAPSQPETTVPETQPTMPETTETVPETTKEPTLEDIINRGNEIAAMPDSPERDRIVSDYCDEVEEFMRKHPNALVGQPEAVRTFVLDAINDRKVGHKRVALAKTGGFAGTAMAYGVGLLLLIGGCGLTLERRKRESDK